MKFTDFPGQQIGDAVRADWARKVIGAIGEQRPRPKPGQTMSRNSYGVMLGPEPSEAGEVEMTPVRPFKVRWCSHGKAGDGNGEWQVYLPNGCVSLDGASAIPLNAKGKDRNGDETWKWYKIDDPGDADADVGTIGDYVAKTWTVYVQLKPWPRFKVTTKAEDGDFGPCKWTIPIATIATVDRRGKSGTFKGHITVRLLEDATIVRSWDANGNFAIRYTVASATSPGANVKAELINITRQFGRLQLNDKQPVDITGWEEVWVKIEHKDTEFKLSVSKASEDGDRSDDDHTVYKIYELKDGKNIVTRDMRSEIEPMDFYTNGPDDGGDE